MRDDVELEVVREAIRQNCPPAAREMAWEVELTAMARAAIHALDAHRRDPASSGPGIRELATLRRMAENRDHIDSEAGVQTPGASAQIDAACSAASG